MPQTLSPFRYPGGKSQLYPFVENLVNINNTRGTYIEPFAGGASVALRLLFTGKVNHIVINDYDASIFAVWNAILNNPEYLIQQIHQVPFDYYHPGNTTENIAFWREQQSIYFEEKGDPYSLPSAFATLFLNRTNRSGIITGGPLGGWEQVHTKIGARFTKTTLIKKILTIHDKRDHISILNEDALILIPKIAKTYDAGDTFIFFDPPYYDQGSSLYYSSLENEDHQSLAKEILALDNYKWITTYDPHPLIRQMYATAAGQYQYELNYSANQHSRAPEFLFSSPTTEIESFKRTRVVAI